MPQALGGRARSWGPLLPRAQRSGVLSLLVLVLPWERPCVAEGGVETAGQIRWLSACSSPCGHESPCCRMLYAGFEGEVKPQVIEESDLCVPNSWPGHLRSYCMR